MGVTHEHSFQSIILSRYLSEENVKLTRCIIQQHELGITIDWHITNKTRFTVAVQRFRGSIEEKFE